MLRYSLALTLLAFAMPASFAQGRIDCSLIHSRILSQPVHYCVLLPPGYDPASPKQYPVLYFFHGLGENEQALFKSGGWNVVEDLRQKKEIGDFLIVTPEAKGTFYINSADGKVRYGDFFLREFMPYLETKYRIRRERRARAVSGISMGGYGAFHFAFAHPELFGSVSAQSAALITQSPREMDAAMQSGTPLGPILGGVFGQPVNAAHWQENNPFVLGRKNKAAISQLAIFFDCGDQDEFGFEEGSEVMDRQLQDEGIKHEFHLYPGNHSADFFLAHLAEVMKFHSRKFFR